MAIESAEAFIKRCEYQARSPLDSLAYDPVRMVKERDAAIRAEARRVAIEELREMARKLDRYAVTASDLERLRVAETSASALHNAADELTSEAAK